MKMGIQRDITPISATLKHFSIWIYYKGMHKVHHYVEAGAIHWAMAVTSTILRIRIVSTGPEIGNSFFNYTSILLGAIGIAVVGFVATALWWSNR